MTRVACQQLAPQIGDLAANAAQNEAAIQEALAAGAEVIVLPELCTSGYMFASLAEATSLAIDRDDPLLGTWREAAADSGAVIAGGFCEQGEDGNLYNSAVIFPGTEEPVFYRKLHLWDQEKLFFTPGDVLPTPIDTAHGRLGLVVCYDLEFPELTRWLALAGVQLLLVPTNWPAFEDRPASERPGEVVIAMGTARVNRMAIACADRCGEERGQAWEQGSTIVGADGWPAAESRAPGMIIADLDLEAALDKRYTELADAFADRRPDIYESAEEPAQARRR